MWTQPGKKLLFMGQEFGQSSEWNHDIALAWQEADTPAHSGVRHLLADLNRVYRAEPALHSSDFNPGGFRWLIGDDRDQSIFAWVRQTDDVAQSIVVLCNFTPVPRYAYRVGVPTGGRWLECLNSDSAIYGGSDLGNLGAITADASPAHGMAHSLALTVPPLGVLILRQDR
jgi:1,4-alpha-glucan branching enzyme